MKIEHRLDDFLYEIFPDVKRGDIDALTNALEQFYTYGAFKPKVTIKQGLVSVDINVPRIEAEVDNYHRVVKYCEQGEFSKAKPILMNLMDHNPTNSEYHRIMGQVLSEEGDQDRAIDYLIDALRWDSKNHFALLMMGNIFAKYKNDLVTAKKYYDQAIAVRPDDHIATNNIGANLMQQGKVEEAKGYFKRALETDPKYPNTHFALGMVAQLENKLYPAFEHTLNAIKLCDSRQPLYRSAFGQAFEIAGKIIQSKVGMGIVEECKTRLEKEGARKIEIMSDQWIPTAAKLEFAENYDREVHRIIYKRGHPSIEHLIAHELVHLYFVIEARQAKDNLLFITKNNHRAKFRKSIGKTRKKLKKDGVPDESIDRYTSETFEGLMSQMYNTPIDLFIEDYLYMEFQELRPYQFLSLFRMLQDGVKAVTSKESIKISPPWVLSKSKILNVVNAMQFKELYGVDLIPSFNPSTSELTQAKEFYSEFNDYRNDKKPAEEYEIVLHWGQDLKLDGYFELVDENEFRTKRTNIDEMLKSIEHDPYNLESKDPYEKAEMESFQKSQAAIGINMAVVMFMVDALQYFEHKSNEEIKKIAIEIAMQGRMGYSPDKNNYRLSSIPERKFSGYHILAYYYVSWSLTIPEMVSQLQLPYEEEYKLAQTMYKPAKDE